jgi:hypothetical protein
MRATTVALSITISAIIGIATGPTLVPIIAGLLPDTGNALQPAIVVVSVVPALLLIVRSASRVSAASATDS